MRGDRWRGGRGEEEEGEGEMVREEKEGGRGAGRQVRKKLGFKENRKAW